MTETVGMDYSLEECHASGYMMIDYGPDLVTEKEVNLDASIHLRQPYGEWFTGSRIQYANLPHNEYIDEYYSLWITTTPRDIVEIYNRHKSGIDNFSGHVFGKLKTAHDVLYLASAVNAYCGIHE